MKFFLMMYDKNDDSEYRGFLSTHDINIIAMHRAMLS